MLRKYWSTGVLALSIIFTAIAVALIFGARPVEGAAQPAAPQAPQDANLQQAAAGFYAFNYSAKFVCGYQRLFGPNDYGEPLVKPGNYATEINIHNYQYKDVLVRKKLLLLAGVAADGTYQIAREPKTVGPIAFDKVIMGPDYAMLDDCNRLYMWMNPGAVPPTPLPLMIGYLVIISPLDLDVDVVYTASESGMLNVEQTSISIDVERVLGKRFYIPQGALPPDPNEAGK